MFLENLLLIGGPVTLSLQVLTFDSVMTDSARWEPSWLTATYVAILGLIAVACLVLNRRHVLGTTLFAPWCWLLLSVGCLVFVEVLAGSAGWNART